MSQLEETQEPAIALQESSLGSALSLEPQTPKTPRRLQPPRILVSYNRTLSTDPSVGASRRSSASALSIASVAEPSAGCTTDFNQDLRSPSVYLKFLQMGLTLVCLALLSDGYPLVVHNVAALHFPFIVYSAYTVVTSVIIFSYAVGMKMRELLMRIFGTLGGILFLISGCHGANIAMVFWADWEGRYQEGNTEEDLFDVTTIPRRRTCFAVHTAIAFAAAAVYFADVAFSLCRTVALLE